MRGCIIDGDTLGNITTDIDETKIPASDFKLYQNYPNPFNPSTTLSFKINNSNSISLIIYTAMGQEVMRLIDNEYFFSGEHEVIWNGKNNANQSVSSGVYYYRFLNGSVNITRSMILLK